MRDVCENNNIYERIRATLGLPDAILSEATRQSVEFCCHTVFQQWLTRGSTPKDNYPRTWNSVIKLLEDVELQELADRVKDALPNKI